MPAPCREPPRSLLPPSLATTLPTTRAEHSSLLCSCSPPLPPWAARGGFLHPACCHVPGRRPVPGPSLLSPSPLFVSPLCILLYLLHDLFPIFVCFCHCCACHNDAALLSLCIGGTFACRICRRTASAFIIIVLSCLYIGGAVAYFLASYIHFPRSYVSNDLTMALQANGIRYLAQALAALCLISVPRRKISYHSGTPKPTAGDRCGLGDCHNYSICVQLSRWNMYSCSDSIA